MKKSVDKGINFVSLDLDSLNMAVFVDEGFTSNPESSSQLGFLITLVDKNINFNIIQYGSLESRRVTRSVLATELLAIVHGFDIS